MCSVVSKARVSPNQSRTRRDNLSMSCLQSAYFYSRGRQRLLLPATLDIPLLSPSYSYQEIVEAEKLQLSGQLESLDTDITRAGGAVEDASNRMQQANTDFSNLMAAMSAAFREYDHVRETGTRYDCEDLSRVPIAAPHRTWTRASDLARWAHVSRAKF